MHNKLLLSLLFLAGAFSLELQAQSFFQCNVPPGNPPLPGATSCYQSCIYCNLDGTTDINNVFLPSGVIIDVCIPVTVENPRWYGFVAGSPSITFVISSFNCQGTDGLEAVVVRDCGASTVACSPGHTGGAGIPLFITCNNLIVGQAYQLMVDGMNGDVCEYKINVVDGTTIPPPMGPLGAIQGLSQVCPGATVTYKIPPVANSTTYTWTSPIGSKINGLGNTAVLPSTTGHTISITFGNTGGSICVSASNACSPPIQTCKSVSNVPLAIVDLPEQTICYEETPFYWQEAPNTPLSAPGTYTLTSSPYTSFLGCDSMVRQKVRILGLNNKTIPPIFLCEGETYEINGFPYTESGTYQEILTSVHGCDSTVNFSIVKIDVNAATQLPDTITCAITSVPLSAQGSSTGPTVMYNWYNPAGEQISNAINATALSPGDYTLIVAKSASGHSCYDTTTVTVQANVVQPEAHAGPAQVLTCSQPELQLQGSGSVGPQYTYLWTGSNGGFIASGANTLTPTVNAAGTYKLKVTNLLNGCIKTSTTSVTALALPPSLSVGGGTFTCSIPTVTLQVNTSATSATYAWTGPNGFASTLQNPVVNAAGDYQLVISDGPSGCTTEATATVIANVTPPGAAASSGSIACNLESFNLNGSSTTPGSIFGWTGPDTFASSLPNPFVTVEGIYQLTVIGANGCTSTASATVTIVPLAPNISATPQTANGSSDGTASANPSGGTQGYTFAWSNNQNLQNIFDLLPGFYTVTVTDALGCTNVASTAVNQYNCATTALVNLTDISCFGAANGTASVDISNGTTPYTFDWNTGDSTASLTNLSAGSYAVSIVDGANCPVLLTFDIHEPDTLLANVVTTESSNSTIQNGTASANPSGGSGPYLFIWSNADSTQTISNLPGGGVFTVTVTDGNGCSAVQTVVIPTGNCGLQTSFQVTHPTCLGPNSGEATIVLLGGTGPFTYAWSSGGNAATETGLGTGEYTVSVLDGTGCEISDTVAVVQIPDLTLPIITADSTSVELGPIGVVTLTLQNLSATVTDNCTLANVAIAPNVFNCADLGDHQVSITATDDSGNISSDTITVTIVDNSPPVLVCPPSITHCFGDNLVNYDAPTATDNCLGIGGGFALVEGLPSGSTFENGLTKITYAYTDGQGNTGSCSFDVTILSQIAVTADSVFNDIGGQHIGTIDLSVSGSLPPYSFEWHLNGAIYPDTTEDLSGLTQGAYQVVITDANGCTIESQIITVDSLVATHTPEWASAVLVYPNPTSGLVSVVFPDDLINKVVYLSVFDATGRKVLNQESTVEKSLLLNLSDNADGLYSILIRMEDGQLMRKLVVHR